MEAEIKRGIVTANGVELFYREVGSGDDVIVCLHGMYGRGEDWLPFMERYGDRFRIIAPDQRGHGLSGKPEARYAAEDMADDIREIMGKLGIERAMLMGHSMGGRNAAFLAARAPELVSSLVILDIGTEGEAALSTRPPEEVTRVDGFTAEWPRRFESRAAFLRQLAKQGISKPNTIEYFLDSLTEDAEGYDLMFSRRAMALIGEYWRKWDDLLPAIRCPVLFLRADKSWCLPAFVASSMVAKLGNCAFREISGSDHNLHSDNPEEFYAAFEEFLSGLAPI
jgi:pimeloyl-ACP methyl ester carboxylesterase